MKKILNKISGVILVLCAVIAWCIYSYGLEGKSLLTNSQVINNTKIGWGVKRVENHAQPDLGKTNVELMEKYSRNIYGK